MSLARQEARLLSLPCRQSPLGHVLAGHQLLRRQPLPRLKRQHAPQHVLQPAHLPAFHVPLACLGRLAAPHLPQQLIQPVDGRVDAPDAALVGPGAPPARGERAEGVVHVGYELVAGPGPVIEERPPAEDVVEIEVQVPRRPRPG